ncbi:MAG TPA: hypothetical protein VIC05_02135, partial [Solirubrobacteraceae bacterium]
LTVGVLAALPVLVSTIRALSENWMPAGDQGIIATRAYDVFSSHAPLVGQYSLVSEVVGHLTYSPGPMLYWLIALPARFGSPHAIGLAIGLANILAALAMVTVARARGGVPLMLASALAIAVMCRSFMPEALHDPWNPSAGLLPFAALVFLCWSVACGEVRLVPAVALVASFSAQCQVAFLAPTVGLVIVGLAGLLISRRTGEHRRAWPWALAAVIILAACWAPPVIDQIEHSPGNFALLYEAATRHSHKMGASAGWRALVHAIGVPPRWLRVPADPFDTRISDATATPSLPATISAAVLLLALSLTALGGFWRRRADIAWAAVIALVLSAAFAAVAQSTPSGSYKVLGYTLWWGSIAGMWVWLTLAWSLYSVLAGPLRARLRHSQQAAQDGSPGQHARLRLAGGALSLLAVGAVALAVSLAQGHDAHSSEYAPITSLDEQLERSPLTPRHSTIWLRTTLGGVASPLSQAIKYLLRREDLRILQYGAMARLGPWYEIDHHRYSYVVYAYDGKPPDAKARIIAQVSMSEARAPYPGAKTKPGTRTVTVSVAPAAPPRR